MMDDHRLPSSLYCDLFYSNPGANEFRRDHLRVWLQVELGRHGRSIPADLGNKFRAEYPGTALTEEELAKALTSLETVGTVETDPPYVVLSTSGTQAVNEARSRHGRSKDEFLGAVSQHVSESDAGPLSHEEHRVAKKCAEEVVIEVLLGEKQALQVLFRQVKNFEFIREQARQRTSDLGRCLRHGLPGMLRTRSMELAREVCRGIAKASEKGRSYLHTLNRSVLASFFLIQDPHHVHRLRQHAMKRTYYLDTNVYLAWMYRSQPHHDIVRPLLRTLVSHGANIKVLPETVEEILGIEAQVKRTVPRARADRSLSDYLVRNRKAIYTDYWWASQRDPNLEFGTWELLYMDPARTLQRLGVEISEVTFAAEEDFASLIPTFRNAIRGIKQERGRVVRSEALDHDAEALVAMAKLQLRGDRDEWGSDVQFLSLDTTLGPALEECRNVFKRRFVKPLHPSLLARWYLPSTTKLLTRSEYETFVVGSIRESLGVLTALSSYSHITIIEKLDQAGIPTATLLEAPPELLEPALAQLQGRRNLNAKLEQALAHEGDERRPWIEQIQEDLEEAISVGSDVLRETSDELERQTTQARSLEMTVATLTDSVRELRDLADKQAGELDASRRQVRLFKSIVIAVGAIVLLGVILVGVFLL